MTSEIERARTAIKESTERSWTRGWAWLLLEQRALYGASAARILVGLACLGILLSNFTMRHVQWGEGSFWAQSYRDQSDFSALFWIFNGDSPFWFTIKYFILIAITIGFVIGWRTRLMNLLLLIGMSALVERADLLGNQGDNIIRIGLLFMLFMNASQYWSVDVRRRNRAGNSTGFVNWLRNGSPIGPLWLRAVAHNSALIALAFQIFILYTASALYKAQGSRWQDGTALFYPLRLHEYSVFPQLNVLITDNPIILTIATYFSFFIQLFFVVGLLHPVSRRIVVVGVIMLHIGIAVLMGLPWFSLAMVAFDTIFISNKTYRHIDRIARNAIAAIKAKFSRKESSPQVAV